MKAILVLGSGGESDGVVFSTALSLAKPLGAHLEFLDIGKASAGRSHNRSNAGSKSAFHRFEELCERDLVEIAVRPKDVKGSAVGANWCADRGNSLGRMLPMARHNDLAVIARPAFEAGLPDGVIELMLSSTGRPL